jgi:imidazole glycerol-phosphate synthase subunit HisF
MRPRIIPVLLLKDGGLVKSVRFKDHRYVGDPINAVRIFNEKEVDELVFLDIRAGRDRRAPDLRVIHDIATECFMPFAYGGGVTTVDQALDLVRCGVEKVVLCSAAAREERLVSEIASRIGSQSVVICVDYGHDWRGRPQIRAAGGTGRVPGDPVDYCRRMQECGAGEILLQSIDRDGTGQGYDLEMLARVCAAVNVPVIACGGAGTLAHLADAIRSGAAAAAAGSLFVFHGVHRAVLISYPDHEELNRVFPRNA